MSFSEEYKYLFVHVFLSLIVTIVDFDSGP